MPGKSTIAEILAVIFALGPLELLIFLAISGIAGILLFTVFISFVAKIIIPILIIAVGTIGLLATYSYSKDAQNNRVFLLGLIFFFGSWGVVGIYEAIANNPGSNGYSLFGYTTTGGPPVAVNSSIDLIIIQVAYFIGGLIVGALTVKYLIDND